MCCCFCSCRLRRKKGGTTSRESLAELHAPLRIVGRLLLPLHSFNHHIERNERRERRKPEAAGMASIQAGPSVGSSSGSHGHPLIASSSTSSSLSPSASRHLSRRTGEAMAPSVQPDKGGESASNLDDFDDILQHIDPQLRNGATSTRSPFSSLHPSASSSSGSSPTSRKQPVRDDRKAWRC